MTSRAGCVVAATCAISFACASTTTTASSLDARFAGQDATRARELAPDLYAEAERARTDAGGTDDDAARRDALDAASLFLDAALAEAERIQFDSERVHVEASIERAVAERAEHQRARLAAEAETARAEAAKLARAEAQRAFDRATENEPRRTKKSERERAHAASAVFLFGRAEMVLAAATALGLPAEAREGAERALAEAGSAKRNATEQRQRAQSALEAAERALGAARAQAQAPSQEEVAGLISEATERGLPIELLERGLAIRLVDAFPPGASDLSPSGRTTLEHVASLARQHPHGPLAIEVPAEGTAPTATKLATARAARVRALLDAGERAKTVVDALGAKASDALQGRIVFTAYASVTTR